MRIYAAKLSYQLVQEGPMEPVSSDQRVVEYMLGAFNDLPLAESFYVIILNRRNKPMGRHLVTQGTATAALAHPREVFRIAVMASAAAVVCVHNHPSGDPSPSACDIQLTRSLKEAGKIIDIPLLDHVIVGNAVDDPLNRGYYSFREAGLI
jgi:DNA repair protein RadC